MAYSVYIQKFAYLVEPTINAHLLPLAAALTGANGLCEYFAKLNNKCNYANALIHK